MRLLSTLQRSAAISHSQARHEEGNIVTLLHSRPLGLLELGKELRRIEKAAAVERRRRDNSSITLTQFVTGVMRRRRSRFTSGLYGLMSVKPPTAKQKDNIEKLLTTIDTFMQWSRSQSRILTPFNNANSDSRVTGRRYFRYARPRVIFQKAEQIQEEGHQFESDDEVQKVWKIRTDFNLCTSVTGCHQEVQRLHHDYALLVRRLRGSHTDTSTNLSILLPPRRPKLNFDDKSLEGSLKGSEEGVENNANASLVVEDENQSQINFENIKFAPEVYKSVPKLIRPKLESKGFQSCKMTLFSAYIALRWVRHVLALANKKGFSLLNQFHFGEISVESQSASLLAILDLSPDNIITCPKLKVSLLKAKATEAQCAQKEALRKGTDYGRHTAKAAVRSPLLFFARNRIRHRRSESAGWSSPGSDSFITSTPATAQTRRKMSRNVEGRKSALKNGGRSGERSSGGSSGGHELNRKDTTMFASRPFRKRSLSSLRMTRRKSSASSNVSILLENDTSEGEGNVRTKMNPTRERRGNAQEKNSMFSMLQRLRMKNAPGYLSLQPVQRMSERIKTILSMLTISLIRGCNYHQIKETRLGPTLAYAVRNQIRDLLVEEHECDATGCQDEDAMAFYARTDAADTAGYRVVTHVSVVETMQQSVIMASQGLQEHRVDTYYSFTFRCHDAIVVATVFLIRQFVRFPNIINSSNPVVRDVYEKQSVTLESCKCTAEL